VTLVNVSPTTRAHGRRPGRRYAEHQIRSVDGERTTIPGGAPDRDRAARAGAGATLTLAMRATSTRRPPVPLGPLIGEPLIGESPITPRRSGRAAARPSRR
jgi:hypothetical protein